MTGVATTESIRQTRRRRKQALAAPAFAFAFSAVAINFSDGSPAWLSFGIVCTEFLLMVLLAVAITAAMLKPGATGILSLGAWFYTAAVIEAVLILAATVTLLAI